MTTAISLNSGNTAWLIMATVLVLMMTIPGIALFYGGLVRRKNMLSVIMQSLSIVAVISIIWVVFGYSLAFGSGFDGNLFRYGIGGFDKLMLKGISLDTITTGGIPELLFVMFQCMFAVITPALILGAFAERVKFSGFLMFTILWSVFVYMPMAHWVWGGGFLMEMGAIDFAGGTVVHINAGVSALVMALLVGRRNDYRPGKPITPHNIPFVFIGTALLWLGWFGFNAGSGLAADGLAANAFLVTHIATCVAAVSWMTVDWIVNRKPTTVGACTGAVAGLVAITPAAGTADIPGAICIGLVASLVCFWMVAVVKPKFGYDDALDAFGVHGMGGMVGSVLTGVFATRAVTGDDGVQGALYGDWHQLWVQTATTLISVVFSAVMTFVIFRITDAVCGIRVMRRVEEEGLDVYEHGEAAYDM
ncbi:ammonium transporter [Leyella lascolaii]|uniref:Ammonium transporter n=1 Tax=Leyella lascolaii TaxID=1776379 RepID=A0AAW7JNT5_9BACT|nr:ammonium transporter [Leyella lascolaii]MDN0023892.1 ammonium transporter [Leyella lascolaii]MDN0026422.1 ammonium transporter [Leyella lascolaii]